MSKKKKLMQYLSIIVVYICVGATQIKLHKISSPYVIIMKQDILTNEKGENKWDGSKLTRIGSTTP